ncbi:formimidoylglutamase [Sinomicrobium weinanense]|uniref:Formimidoylglutamase n=1 Tax=Sinomicrobium weinanense TaxID=2842200 RepID=A0A926Q1Y2_9FLAO|nr:formimidoylglutamase [Sinomicrobium weinanense]MBC9795998.1 formimidoylglutamase [Sinomicrobium weinanense]MBU3122117.1 formimidoylglutamase [Sinomicrobium weinanense]
MRKFLNLYTLRDVEKMIRHRKGEVKFGQRIRLMNEGQELEEQLGESEAKYVLFGIPEDIGIMANHGRKGARHAWNNVIQQLLNTQNHRNNRAKRVLLLGHLDFSEEIRELGSLDPSENSFTEKARELTGQIDVEVTDLIRKIVQAGKKPIVVGGGHNNCYGILKGCALALGKPMNCINIDAHTDFRNLEGRHSGNGFSYAFREGFLQRYFIFGLHENYTSKSVYKKMQESGDRIRYNTLEELLFPSENGIDYQTKQALEFVNADKYGIEIDCDAIRNVPSSAMSPTGFSVEQVRRLIHHWKSNKNAQYLHICEAAPHPENEDECRNVGKMISYFITDFIRK